MSHSGGDVDNGEDTHVWSQGVYGALYLPLWTYNCCLKNCLKKNPAPHGRGARLSEQWFGQLWIKDSKRRQISWQLIFQSSSYWSSKLITMIMVAPGCLKFTLYHINWHQRRLQCLPLPCISQITLHSLCAFYKLRVMIKRQKGRPLEGLEWATAMSLSPRGSFCDVPDGVRQCECLTVLLRYNFRNNISFSHLEWTM